MLRIARTYSAASGVPRSSAGAEKNAGPPAGDVEQDDLRVREPFVFAAAGSLVSRAEDVSSAVMPVLMATLVPFGVAIATAQDLNATWVRVVQYLPPFSMLVMPLQVSAHHAGWGPNLLAALLMMAAAAGPAVLSARVYQRSILRIGTAVRRREALMSVA
ncbi:hypothetical protein [Streptomyces sp. MK7]|uniref:hypothetical protein n=1 Tax=Streptomyces sp. MK7 TaxID=3067635 RepID=UPI00292EAD60|nr:hypothetical protein [Streptomyces sp. MK7]